MAVFTFKHAFIGKAKQAAGTASAHVRYITRKSATHAIASEGMPRHRHAVQRFMDEREASIRKNGRVCDKFIIAVPKEMDQAQALHTLRRFGNKISHRWDSEQQRVLKASYFLTLQDWDTHNPHCHFIFVDADRETGERVFGTTRKGSTERLRAVWEATCNDELERLGIEARIDRRAQHVIEAERAARTELDRGAENQSAAQEEVPVPELSESTGQLPPPHAPTHEIAESPASAHEQELVQEDEMEEDRHPALDPEHPDFVDEDAAPSGPATVKTGATPMGVKAQVTAAHQFAQNVQTVRKARHELTTLRQSFETALKSAQAWKGISEKEARRIRDYELATAEAHGAMRAHLNENGKMRGFSLFGMRTPARKRAEAAAHNVVRAQRAENDHVIEVARLTKVATEQTRAAEIASARLKGFDLQLAERKLGNEQDMAQAETIFLLSQREAVATLRPVEVYRAWEDGVVEPEEALSALSALGDMEYAKAIEASMEQEQGEGLGA